MATENQNPFGALVTPEVLSAQRRAQFEQEYQGANPWIKLAAEAGFNTRELDRARGIGLTPEDVKAKRNQDIMSTAQKRHAELVAGGKVTADEAQASVLEEAIKQFAANGEWEQALSLTQPLNALKEQALTRRKLQADAAYSESRPEAKALDQELAAMKANQQYAIAEGRLAVMEQNAKTAADKLDVMMEIARLREEQRAAIEEARRNKPSAREDKLRIETGNAVMGAADAGFLMADLREQIMSSPGALSETGELASKMAGYATSAKTLLQKNNWNPDELKNGGSAKEWVRLNVSNARQRALVINLAYAFARANDPGGRLSDNDLKMAVEVVSGTGGPEARLATLDQAFTGLARSTQGKIGLLQDNEMVLGPNTVKRFQDSMNRYRSLSSRSLAAAAQPQAPAAAPAAPLSFEEFKRRKAAGEL